MPITAASASAMSAASVQGQAGVLVASKVLSSEKIQGAEAEKLIASAAPSTGDHRGSLVNVMA